MRFFCRFCAVILVCLAIFFPQHALSQFNAWHYAFSGEGEYIGMNPVNPNTLFAQGQDFLLYVSHDRGTTWSSVGSIPNQNSSTGDQTRDILVSPRDTNTILASAFYSGLSRSTDGGATWNVVLEDSGSGDYGIDGESIEFDPVHPDTIYAGCYFTGDIWRSTDRGASWTLQGNTDSPGSSVMCTLAIRPDSTNILYAGSGGGRISKSTDGGVTWQVVKSAGSTEIPKIEINPAQPTIAYATAFEGSPGTIGVWKTTDGGNTWALTSLQISVWSLELDESHPDTVYAGSFANGTDGVYRTTDGGNTWVLMTYGFFSGNAVWNLKVDPINPSNVYASVTIGDFGPYGVLKLIAADAIVTGTVRDSLTSHVVNYGSVTVSPSGDYTDLSSSNGAFTAFRPLADTSDTYYVNVSTFGYIAKSQPIAFVHDSIENEDVLIQRGVIRGLVFNDLNGNGVQDPGEPPLANWPIELIGAVSANVVTAGDGTFQIADLLDGSDYELADKHEYGWKNTSPGGASAYYFTVSQYQKVFNNYNFSEHLLSIVNNVTPLPNAEAASTQPNIQVTFSRGLLTSSVNDTSSFVVTGGWSGKHPGTITFSDTNAMVTYQPVVPFAPGEPVTVDATAALTDDGGNPFAPYTYQFFAPPNPAPGSFLVRYDYAVGTSPYAVAVADLNGDGKPDIVVANSGSNSVSVLINRGNGMFAPRVNYSASLQPHSVAIADVNNDGAPDIITGATGSPTISVLINHGDGTFAPAVGYSAAGTVQQFVVADMNGDGFPDIVAVSGNSNELQVLLNNGSGGFGSPISVPVSTPIGCVAAALKNDGAIDVATIANTTYLTLQTFTNVGSGSLSAGYSYSTASDPHGIFASDLNGDTYNDLVISNGAANAVSVYTNDGTGAFPSKTDYTVGAGPWGIACGDLNSDGKNDILVANSGSASVSVLLNSGGGVFTRTDYSVGSAPHGVAVADINQDGMLDLIVANTGSNSVTVLLNGTPIQSSTVEGWNMISVPVVLGDYAVSTLFPSAVSAAYSYSAGYHQIDSVSPGNGYWLKFPSGPSMAYIGTSISAETVAVNALWNMVGSVSSVIDTSLISSQPPGIIVSPFYGYSGGYYSTDSLHPGSGYWVKVSTSGSLYLAGSGNKPGSAAKTGSIDHNSFNTLTISDHSRHSQTLYFSNSQKDAEFLARYEMPPLPPSGSFDARFTDQRMAMVSSGNTAESRSVQIQSAVYPITLSWHVAPGSGGWEIVTPGLQKSLTGQGSLTIPQPPKGDIALAYSPFAGVGVPQRFALEQNYPNPFNPTTTIQYELPQTSRVTMRVYDVLGQSVATLVDQTKEGGIYSVVWDGSNTSAGVYYVAMSAHAPDGKLLFESTRKIVLVK
jgi:photosystem II stability/assembly factor-like uncharacterized protein